MGVLTTKSLQPVSGANAYPVIELVNRVVQRYENSYTSGMWNPDNNYNWAPGSYVDFTPKRADSRIVYMWRVPHCRDVGSSHAISHWRFYVNGAIWFYHSVSGRHIEDGCVIKWEVPSWGTSQGRIGYTIRSYSNDNHEVRLYSTDYWNGGGSNQNCKGQLIVEEIASVSIPTSARENINYAK